MRFDLSLVVLTTALFASNGAHARPLEKSKRDDGMIHLPLTRSHNLERTDIHPQLLYQQHANRGIRRLARMTGRAVPSDDEMRNAIAKRMYLPAGGLPKIPLTPADKRMFVPSGGIPKLPKKQQARDFLSNILGGLGSGSGKAKDKGAAKADTPDAKAPAPAPTPAAPAAVANVTDPAAPANVTDPTGTNAAGSTADGFSQVDLDAALADTVTASDVKDGADTTGLDIEANDVGYSSLVAIGTPPQNFALIMDSGSADLWVAATKCTIAGSTQACSTKHKTLGSASSSSFASTGKAFQVTYGSGAVAGTIISDDVTLATLPLKAHTFGVSQVETVQFGADTVPTDGLMGLAQSTLSNQGVLTPVESLAKSGAIKEAITSYKISRLADGKNDGQVTFGGLDSTKFDAATLVSIPNVSKTGFWEGAVDSITVDGKDTGLAGRTAILDTGTTLIIAPPDDATAVHATIPGAKSDGQGGFTVPCTSNASVALSFGGKSFAIDPRDLTFLPVDQTDLKGDCTSGISSGQIGGATEWLVGDVFLKNAYFSTDVGKNTVSLAKLV